MRQPVDLGIKQPMQGIEAAAVSLLPIGAGNGFPGVAAQGYMAAQKIAEPMAQLRDQITPLLRQLRISCAVRRQIAEFSDQRAKSQGRLVVPEARCITHSLV